MLACVRTEQMKGAETEEARRGEVGEVRREDTEVSRCFHRGRLLGLEIKKERVKL